VATVQGSDRRAERAPSGNEKPAAELAVERVTHQDVPAICTLYKKVWESVPGLPAELVKAWQPAPLEFTSWMEGVTYFAARRAGRMVGVVGCEPRHGAFRIVHLAVDPEARRQGVASALVGAVVEWARHSNAVTLWADPLARFEAAGALFSKLGFTSSGALHKHEWGEDVHLFERVL
jgi:GNAT superfamily N-acetyltransferase